MARSAGELVAILKESRVDTLVDVRAYPASRRHPQFSSHNLQTALAAAGIGYDWQGRRSAPTARCLIRST